MLVSEQIEKCKGHLDHAVAEMVSIIDGLGAPIWELHTTTSTKSLDPLDGQTQTSKRIRK